MTDRLHHAPSLKAHISLVLTALIAVMMAVTAVVWMRETRNAIHEEVEAATRVAEQWLNVLIPETLADGPQARERLMHHLEAVGRIRANRLEVFDSLGGASTCPPTHRTRPVASPPTASHAGSNPPWRRATCLRASSPSCSRRTPRAPCSTPGTSSRPRSAGPSPC